MSKIILGSIIIFVLMLFAVACEGQATSAPIKATWVTPQLDGDSVSIPVAEVKNNKIVHFRVPVATGGTLAFMAYDFDGEIKVRANVCPPCRSIGFSLSGDILVCDTCRTLFDARTGDGISGACVAYPKAAISFTTSGANLVMNADEMNTAYRNTMEPGLP